MPAPKVPGSVAVVAAGLSHREYVAECLFRGGRRRLADETWAINHVAGVLAHDRAFLMDAPATLQRLARDGELPEAVDFDLWLRDHPGPVYCSATDPRYPGIEPYPLEDVINTLGGETYINSTVAAAVAYARHIGVRHLMMYGCDFTSPGETEALREAGRACVEHHLMGCEAAGMTVTVARGSTLRDTDKGQPVYGYERPLVVSHDGHRYRVKET